MRRHWKAAFAAACLAVAVLCWYALDRPGLADWRRTILAGFLFSGVAGVFTLSHLAMARLLSFLPATVFIHPHRRLAMTIILCSLCLMGLYFLLTTPVDMP